MGLRVPKKKYSVAEYLELERSSEERSEYLDGDILLMAGESREHADISSNLLREIGNQLKGTACRAWTKDMKVRSGPAPENATTTKGLYSHPDIVVVCGEPEFHDAHTDILLNPKVIIEILSESTEAFDRGEKFTRMQKWNPTLTDYVLISQDKPQIEHFAKPRKGAWTYQLFTGLDAQVEISSIHSTLKMTDVYDRVIFPEG